MRGLKYSILASLFFIFSLSKVVAQDNQEKKVTSTITGNVVDKNNNPIAGVTVEVQEENRRTVSAKDGSYTIKAASDDILIFSKKGYASSQKAVATTSTINMILETTKIGGGEDDNVIIPFGSRKKRELNYAISKLDVKDIPQIPTSNILNLLGGRIPGLYVQQTNSTIGSESASLQIRGLSTYNDGNSPTVLVDGIPRDPTGLDINEIESVTVLKDAAALTWYGLNAANGVVLINTRKGSSKKMSLNFTTQEGIQQSSNRIKPLNSYDYATLYNEALTNVGQPAIYNQAALDAYANNSSPYLYPNNNYIDSFLKTSAPVQRHVLSVDGGSNNFRYFTLLSYLRQDGFFKPSETTDFNSNAKFQRINFRVNLDYDVTKNLSVSLYAGAGTGSTREPLDGGYNLLSDLYNLPPNTFPITNPDGSYGGTSVYQNNPLARLQDRGYVRNLNRSLMVNLNATQKINFIKGLSANVLFSYDAQGNYTSGLSKNYEVYDMTGTTPVKYRTAAPLNYLGAYFSNNNRHNEIWAGFDYDREFKSIHKINASIRGMRSEDANANRLDYRGQQVSARVDYALMDRYFVGAVASYAGSENFPPGKRYGFFPAVSAGWILSEEAFVPQFIKNNYIKLRASYGSMGNGNIGGARLPYRNLYRAPAGFGYNFGTSFGATVSADEINPIGNPNITWETLNRLNVGADFNFLKRALSLSVDYFNDIRNDILTAPRTPSILGATLTGVNEGVVTSRGVDGSIGFEKDFGDFGIGLNANYTYAKNNVVSVNEDPGIPSYQSAINYNTGNVDVINTKRFYISQGLFQSQAEIDAAPKQLLAGKVVPGDIRYKDVNNDGVINSLDAVNTDYTDIPSSYYGFGLNLHYKSFQLSGQFEGVAGRTIQIRTIVNSGPSNLNGLSLDRWTPATATTAKYPRLAISDRANNDANSDFWLRSGDFLKLRTAEFSYSIPAKLSQRLKIEKAKLFVSGYNLLTFSKLDINVDPEMPYAGYGSAYPYMKIFSVGLNIQF
jgi:TonB-dependent starch-binding outer membrane protein SusC